jgi:hypothetical protein
MNATQSSPSKPLKPTVLKRTEYRRKIIKQPIPYHIYMGIKFSNQLKIVTDCTYPTFNQVAVILSKKDMLFTGHFIRDRPTEDWFGGGRRVTASKN